jgi:sulfatase maturation enzyme AslB (radical SAM superfamily)
MRINNAGHYEYCRWADKSQRTQTLHIWAVSPQEFFQQHMTPIRNQLLAGEQPLGCAECAVMEQHNKVSGRQKQLLKVGVRVEQFEKTLVSSPWVDTFASDNFNQLPQDWQIDLGNYCNSACVFCDPHSSSRIAQEYQRIGLIQSIPPSNWTDDPVLVKKFVDTLTQSSHIQYLHFIGGETVITPAFKTILQSLVRAGLNRTATIGFTTNLTVWNSEVVDLLTQFQGVNLGMSVESFEIVNDYVRWPSKLSVVLENLDRWQEIASQQGWLLQLRTTPTLFSVSSLLSIYDYAWDKKICVESCNFLTEPAVMRPSVLPPSDRLAIVARMRTWLDQHPVSGDTVLNIRDPSVSQLQNHQDLQSYVNYLENMPDESNRLPELMVFLKRLESSRNNSILFYLPEYEELFRSAGY